VDDIASVDDMNSVVRNISDILYKYAFEVYGRSVLIRDNVNPERPNNEWFDEKEGMYRWRFEWLTIVRKVQFKKYRQVVRKFVKLFHLKSTNFIIVYWRK
jgi:hypothetical protein